MQTYILLNTQQGTATTIEVYSNGADLSREITLSVSPLLLLPAELKAEPKLEALLSAHDQVYWQSDQQAHPHRHPRGMLTIRQCLPQFAATRGGIGTRNFHRPGKN